jgi:hypothetical protein
VAVVIVVITIVVVVVRSIVVVVVVVVRAVVARVVAVGRGGVGSDTDSRHRQRGGQGKMLNHGAILGGGTTVTTAGLPAPGVKQTPELEQI